MVVAAIPVPVERLAQFCQQHGIRRLALFGSVLRDDFRPDSDIDLLVDFLPEQRVGLLTMARLERELGGLFEGRRVDLRTPDDLSPYFRDSVVTTAQVIYEQS